MDASCFGSNIITYFVRQIGTQNIYYETILHFCTLAGNYLTLLNFTHTVTFKVWSITHIWFFLQSPTGELFVMTHVWKFNYLNFYLNFPLWMVKKDLLDLEYCPQMGTKYFYSSRRLLIQVFSFQTPKIFISMSKWLY